MVYLNMESDMDTIKDYIIDLVAGSPNRNRTVNGNVCMHVDDLIFRGTDSLVGLDVTEHRSVLGKLNWLQSRTQFHISYRFSRCASASASATILDAKELNKVVRLVKDKPQRLLYAPIKGVPRLMGFPDAAYKNNSDGSSQSGQCIFICQPRKKERDTRGSLIDYKSHKI